MNACPMGEDFKIADPEDDLDTRVNEMKILNEKVLSNIENAQKRQQKSYRNRKRKLMSTISPGDEVLISQDFNIKQRKDTLADRHKGPFTVDSISKKGVASVVKDNGTRCCINVSRLRPFYRLENHGAVPCVSLQDHEYGTPDEATDHPYPFSGEKWEKDLGPLQEKLVGDDSTLPIPNFTLLHTLEVDEFDRLILRQLKKEGRLKDTVPTNIGHKAGYSMDSHSQSELGAV
ncbi:uncharacterized protein LOC125804031 [Astyanax mexicanus]|uniref:uncharacterized protein LOC125804031 n=1 Tax=Astyanax mexicanus TaxID=7994 RepID=UPI0020CB3709|nr:uncharacterized protein LOC125804031 [Astyanax mexicanus]